MGLQLNTVKYRNLDNCLELTNGVVKLVITIDFGPRVLFYGYVDGQNFFKIFDDDLANVSQSEWKSYGGHRLWHAPEVQPRTYFVDAAPVLPQWDGEVLTLICSPESCNSLAKTIDIHLDPSTSEVKLVHKITNIGPWDIELAAWALSVMAPGGRLIVPQEPYVPHGAEPGGTFEAARPLVLWPFTRMNDPRFTWGAEFIQMRQCDEYTSKLKFGALNKQCWAAYALNGEVFIKHHDYFEDGVYPDYGCNAEYFTMPGFLEIESLSPLTLIPPRETLEHFESWQIAPINLPENEPEIARLLSPYIHTEK